MKSIAVINYKGGVGKTTLSANIVAELAFRGNKVLAIDLDPQASLTFSFLKVDFWKDNLEKKKTIKNWYDAFIDKDHDLNLKNLIYPIQKIGNQSGKLDLIASHLALINVDLDLATRLVGGNERDIANNYLRVHSRLRVGLESVASDYDYIVIDCPPNFNVVTKTAIATAQNILIPTKPDYLSTLGIEQLAKHVGDMIKKYNNYSSMYSDGEWGTIDPKILGVVFTMIQLRSGEPISALKPFIEQVKEMEQANGMKIPVLKTMIRENKSLYSDSSQYGVPVVLQRVTPNTTYSEVQKELERLTAEIVGKA